MRLSADEARQLFVASRIARLATVDDAGRPHLVPVVFAARGDRIVFATDHKPKSGGKLRRLANIESNPRVSLLADQYDEDWAQLWWVRADGHATIHERADLLVDQLVAKYPQYQQRRPNGPVVEIGVTRWTGWHY
jgi:PPOX class probable F420-dependent enzyme